MMLDRGYIYQFNVFYRKKKRKEVNFQKSNFIKGNIDFKYIFKKDLVSIFIGVDRERIKLVRLFNWYLVRILLFVGQDVNINYL